MRSGYGQLGDTLTAVVRTCGDNGFCFGDLVEPAGRHGATVGQVAEWMAQSRSRGLIETMDADPDDRTVVLRYRIVRSDYPNRGIAPSARVSTNPVTPSAVEPR
jgi:hypothetical protein